MHRYGRHDPCPVCAAAGSDVPSRSRCACFDDEQGRTVYLCATATADVPGFTLVGDGDQFLGARRFRATDAGPHPFHRPARDESVLDAGQAQPIYRTLIQLVREHAHADLPVAHAEVERRGMVWSDHFLARPSAREELTILRELHTRHPELITHGLNGLLRSKGYLRLPRPASTDGELWIALWDADQQPVGILRRLLGAITDDGGKYRLIGASRAAFVSDEGDANSFLIAEGPIKAMLAAQHLAMPAAAVPSVWIARAVREDLYAHLDRARPRRVLLAPDAGDLREGHPDVEKAVRGPWKRLARFAASRGAEVVWGWWEREKGIDDALAAGVAVEWLTWPEYAARWASPPSGDDAGDDSAESGEDRPFIDEPSVEADPQVMRESLPLDDARARARELLEVTSRTRHSLDLSGVAGFGKSYAAVDGEIDRLTAGHGKLRAHPLSVFTVGAGRELAVERHATIAVRVSKLGMADEIAIRLGLGRQPLQVGDEVLEQHRDDLSGLFAEINEKTAPHGFVCPMLQESAERSRAGFHGCAGCPFEPAGPAPSPCQTTEGAFLHDWTEVRRTTTEGPTILVMTQAAASANFHSRVGRTGSEVRWTLDDTDDVHAGTLKDFILTKETLLAAAATAEMGRQSLQGQASSPGMSPLQSWIARLAGKCNSLGVLDETADPAFVAWLLAEVLPAIAPSQGPAEEAIAPAPERLGEMLQQLAQNYPLRDYVLGHSFGARQAWTEWRDRWRAPQWRGLGVGALIWRMLHDNIEHGALPTVFDAGDGAVRVVTVDQDLVAASRGGRVTRLGTAPLPAFVRKLLGFTAVHELVVPVRSRVLTVKHPYRASWGRREPVSEKPSLADRLATSIADDLLAAHPGRFLFVGGIRDAKRASGRYPVAVAGRDDRATNQWCDALDALLIRRLAPPAWAVHRDVSALLAGLGRARPALEADGTVPIGQAPSGALLPLDPNVREAWLARRASTVRNGIGRARAVKRDTTMILLALDLDLERWPELILPGYRVEVCSIDGLATTLGIPTPRTDAARGRERASHDPRPERTAERRDRVATAVAAGARTVRDLSQATELPRETVRRMRGHERPTVALEDISMRELWVIRVRGLAELSHEHVVDLAFACNVSQRTVRRWRKMARRLVAGEVLGPRALAALESALCVFADMPFAPPDEPPAGPAAGQEQPSEPAQSPTASVDLDLLLAALCPHADPHDHPPASAVVDRLPLGSPDWSVSRPTARQTVSRLLPDLAPARPRRPKAPSRRSRRAMDVAWAILELRPEAEFAGIDSATALELVREIVEADRFGEADFQRALAIAAAASAWGAPGIVMEAFRETLAAATPP
ncbi:MAG: hypothetical protein U1F36_08510 [Planctomycetota bacterium]